MLDETWSFGVMGRTGRGLTEAQNVDASQVDMLVGSLAGPLCAGGGFCAGSTDVVEHQRISAASYTFSAALPAMLATTASETLNMLQTTPEILVQCRENIKAMRAQLDPRSDWVHCTSSPENPVMLLVLKPDIVNSRRLNIEEQEKVLQECVDEVSTPLLPISIKANAPLDSRQRRPHHPPQKHARRQRRKWQRRWMEIATSPQSLRHNWSLEEGD